MNVRTENMRFGAALVVAALALVGCSNGGDAGGSKLVADGADHAGGENPKPAPEPEWEPAQVVQTEFFGTPLDISVYPVIADAEQLFVHFEVEVKHFDGGEAFNLGRALTRDSAKAATTVKDLRLVDRESSTLFAVARDGSDVVAGTNQMNDFRIEPDEGSGEVFAFFAGSVGTTVDLDIPFLTYVADLPVIDAAEAGEEVPTLSKFGVNGDIASESFELRKRAVDYGETSNLSEGDGQINWSLASDVLFDFGEYDLDKKAKTRIEETIAEIEQLAVENAEIHLVGHTDDQGSAAFNQELSEKRAASVKKVFEDTLPSGYKITSEGKGKTQPAVEGTSEDARAANRRVEILFTAKEDANISKRGAGEVPETDAQTVSGHEQLEFIEPAGARDWTAGIRVKSVKEIDDEYLSDEIEIEVLESKADQTTMMSLFVDGGYRLLGRALGISRQGGGTGLLTIATEKVSLYPVEYIDGEAASGADSYDVLGDPRPLGTFTQGDIYTLHVLWPNPGTDTVTIEVPGRMRFADVEVER